MFNKSKTIILVALEDELPKKYLPTWDIIYTGVGKINAAYSLSKAIHEFAPNTVINFGTAGLVLSFRSTNDIEQNYTLIKPY